MTSVQSNNARDWSAGAELVVVPGARQLAA